MKSMETLKQQEHDYELMLKMLKDLKARDAKILDKARAINQESENARVIELSEEIIELLKGEL